MGEVGGAVARRHRREGDSGLLERGFLEREHPIRTGGLADAELMPREVEQGGGQVLGGGEALVEGARREHPVEEVARDRLAGLVVDGVVPEHLRPGCPHLVHLRGVLHEVAGDRGPGEVGIADVREEAVQGVPELVEQGDDLVEGQQGGFALRGLGDVQVVRDHRLRPEQAGLGDVGVHPGAAPLRGPGVEVAEEEPERGAVLLEHFPDADVRVIDGQFGPFLEGQPEELGGREEDPVHQHAVHLEVGPELGGVEGKPLGSQLLGVVGPVPGGDFEVGALGAGQFRQVLGFTAGVGHGPRGETRQPSVDRLDGLRRLFLEDVGGVVRVAEQCGALGAEGGDPNHRLPVVVLPTPAAPRERGLHDPLAERAVLER